MGGTPLNDQVAELMERLGISGHHLATVRLGPGVVGRNSSIAWALEVVMLAGVVCGGLLKSPPVVVLSLVGAIGMALWISHLNVRFGREDPAAALLEGGQFLQFHQMQLTAAKDQPPAPGGPAAPPPAQLRAADAGSLPGPSGGGQ